MAKQVKIAAEEKIRIARAYIDGKTGQSEAAAQIGIDKSTVRDWVRLYIIKVLEAFVPGKRSRRYSPESREASVKAYLAGEGILRDICKRYQIRDKKQLRA